MNKTWKDMTVFNVEVVIGPVDIGRNDRCVMNAMLNRITSVRCMQVHRATCKPNLTCSAHQSSASRMHSQNWNHAGDRYEPERQPWVKTGWDERWLPSFHRLDTSSYREKYMWRGKRSLSSHRFDGRLTKHCR